VDDSVPYGARLWAIKLDVSNLSLIECTIGIPHYSSDHMTTARILSRAPVPVFICNSYFHVWLRWLSLSSTMTTCCEARSGSWSFETLVQPFLFERCFGSVPLSQNWFGWPGVFQYCTQCDDPRSRQLYPLALCMLHDRGTTILKTISLSAVASSFSFGAVYAPRSWNHYTQHSTLFHRPRNGVFQPCIQCDDPWSCHLYPLALYMLHDRGTTILNTIPSCS
jgi:hypothetical protein